MSSEPSTFVLSYWIPFAGPNPNDLGTRFVFYPDRGIHELSRTPEKRQPSDRQITMGAAGLQEVLEELWAYAAAQKEVKLLYSRLCYDLLLSHQQRQRQLS